MHTFADENELHRTLSMCGFRRKVALLLFQMEGTPEEVDEILSPLFDRPVGRLGDVYVGVSRAATTSARRLAACPSP